MTSSDYLSGLFFDSSLDSNPNDAVTEVGIGFSQAKLEEYVANQKAVLNQTGASLGSSGGASQNSSSKNTEPTDQKYTAELAGYALTMNATNWLLLLIAFLLFLILIFNGE